MKVQQIGAIVNMIGSLGMIGSIVAFAAPRFQLHVKIMIPILFSIFSVILSSVIAVRDDPVLVVSLSSIAMAYPIIVFLCIGSLLLGMAFMQGMHSIQIPLFFIVLCALVAFGGSVTSIVAAEREKKPCS